MVKQAHSKNTMSYLGKDQHNYKREYKIIGYTGGHVNKDKHMTQYKPGKFSLYNIILNLSTLKQVVESLELFL